MCVKFCAPVFMTPVDVIVYKVVHPTPTPDVFVSQFLPSQRNKQRSRPCYASHGVTMSYQIGQSVTSLYDYSPGLYAYFNLAVARAALVFDTFNTVILRCRIPAGTRMRKGENLHGYPCCTTETLEVLERVPHKSYPSNASL